jgi:hypothetical protein
MTAPRFKEGDLVRRIAAPDQMGVVRELYPSEYGDEYAFTKLPARPYKLIRFACA